MRALKSSLVLGFIATLLGGCGGGGSGGSGNSGAAADYFSINDVRFTENGSGVTVEGYLDQTGAEAFQLGGQVGFVSMYDAQSGNVMSLQVASTVDGLPGTHSFLDFSAGTYAMARDSSVAADAIMMANGSGTGGSITIASFGNIGQPITGSYNVKLCDTSSVCSTSIKNYTGNFSAKRVPNLGSVANPAMLLPSSQPFPWRGGISPVTGKNYYSIVGNNKVGTLTLTLTPSVDVNMAVFTDAGFTTPATCDVAGTLNVPGSGVETCAITVVANQQIYMTVSQAAAATASETYDLIVAKN